MIYRYMNLFFPSSEFKNFGFWIWLLSFGKWIIGVSSKVIVRHSEPVLFSCVSSKVNVCHDVTFQMSLVVFWANDCPFHGWQRQVILFVCEYVTIRSSDQSQWRRWPVESTSHQLRVGKMSRGGRDSTRSHKKISPNFFHELP